jgi:peroxiredoxin
MAVASTMLPLGTAVPSFKLRNAVDGRWVAPADYASSQALLVMFICNHCPYVIHVRDEITRLARDYMPKGLAVIAINSNSLISHPQDGPDEMQKLARSLEWSFPFVFDETQEVARAFKAACTPEFYLFDKARRLAYRGQLDDSRPGNDKPATGRDLRAAIEATLAGKPVSAEQRPSMGCSIKWHPERS